MGKSPLTIAYREGKPNAARWLATYIYAKYCLPGQVDGRHVDEYRSLLEFAIRQDPNDDRARSLLHRHLLSDAESMPVSDIRDILGHASDRNACRDRLIGQFSSWFEHSLHHLPTGVICEHDNAPENLVEKLNLFCELVDEAGRTEEFASDISFWRLHFEGYCDYLANRHTYPSYRDYLAKHGRL